MSFLTSYCTDKGIKKSTNQDALLIKSIKTAKGHIGLFVVCDGMGGLEKGELASGTLISKLSEWFNNEVPKMINEEARILVQSLNDEIKDINKEIVEYSQKNQIQLGTTITAFICIYDEYYIIQVGDSRAYKISTELELLTEDQTYVMREVQRGNITLEDAKFHKKRNVLLQCIGVNLDIEPVISHGEIEKESIYMICSDGLHHKLSDRELEEMFNPTINCNTEKMNKTTSDVVDLVKERKETDNITVLLIRIK